MTAIYVALVIYMVVLFGVGLFYSKKNATINDFLLAGRDLGVVAATLTGHRLAVRRQACSPVRPSTPMIPAP